MGTAEARAAGLRAAATLTDATAFTVDGEPVDLAAMARAVAPFSGAVGPGGEPGLPVGTVATVRLESPSELDIHRVRCALAAEDLATIWLPSEGVLAVGRT
jgi:coenzyme F420-0:L-glutamate ligase/coenzyme F420-1:gamma-L-glutamate ligase